ncbi:sulfotransferase family protein [Mycolicibacterium moriokaense]|nr:sulfotransferase family protein [Mycolicibacterium moriokaense]
MTAPADRNGSARRPVILFVLGMGRSGTSALTRVLSLCGTALPQGMLGADPGNPRGYWEPRAGLHLNEKFLYEHGSSYFDPTLRLQEAGALGEETCAAFVSQVEAYLRTLPTAPVVVVKVLHISFLTEMWFEAANRAGFDVATAIAVRDPQEVAASLAKHMQATPQLSNALWLKYNLLAEKGSRGVPRVFCDYANLLDDWQREVKRISAILPVDLDTANQTGVANFLEQGLRRQRQCGPVTESFGTDWLSVVYDALSSAARDAPVDEETLDRVFDAYRASEHGFRTAITDFRGHFNLRYRFSRRFMKPVFEAFAIAHRHQGTWA